MIAFIATLAIVLSTKTAWILYEEHRACRSG
jgi:hypothetical protein